MTKNAFISAGSIPVEEQCNPTAPSPVSIYRAAVVQCTVEEQRSPTAPSPVSIYLAAVVQCIVEEQCNPTAPSPVSCSGNACVAWR